MDQELVFKDLIKNDLYQVFLFSSPAHMPFSSCSHGWFVINKKGEFSRYEIDYKKNIEKLNFGHINVNRLPPFEGLEVFSFLNYPRWKTTFLGQIEGGAGSSAQKMCEFIENSINTYNYKDKYFLFGPNSNTYIQWVLDNNPYFKGNLKWNGLGKGYKV